MQREYNEVYQLLKSLRAYDLSLVHKIHEEKAVEETIISNIIDLNDIEPTHEIKCKPEISDKNTLLNKIYVQLFNRATELQD
jgi:hypothetical protein